MPSDWDWRYDATPSVREMRSLPPGVGLGLSYASLASFFRNSGAACVFLIAVEIKQCRGGG
jgi:hypothetical protein